MLIIAVINVVLIFLFCVCSWPRQDRHPDRLLPHEALPLHCCRGHRLDSHLQAWLGHRSPAEFSGRVSGIIQRNGRIYSIKSNDRVERSKWIEIQLVLFLSLYRKQHGMWMDGDLYRSKQPRLRYYPERDLAHFISSLDDVSLCSTSLNALSMDEVLRFRRCLKLFFFNYLFKAAVISNLSFFLSSFFFSHRMISRLIIWA